jgi:hypothetical protein
MSNLQISNVTTDAICCHGRGGTQVFPYAGFDVAIAIFSLLVFGLCSLFMIFGFCRRLAWPEVEEEEAASHESKEDMRREFVSNGLIVKEWVPVDPQVESTIGDEATPPPEEMVESPQPRASPIHSSLASCAMGSDDCESLAGEEDSIPGCAICLSHFKSQELVCESNNSSCQHIFHKDCMVDWLMKYHDNCPMCREVYILKTV